jgi:2-methylisocitrate lyase-like PEP mutase family enzyme
MKDAIERVIAFKKLGADSVFIEAPTSKEEM